MSHASTTDTILLFDGECAFCNGCVRWLLRHERSVRYRFASLQSSEAVTLLTVHGIMSGDLASLVVIDGGKLYRKSEAVLHLLRDVRWPWPALRIFALLPRPMRDAVYDYIGAHRYRWWGKAESCVIADPALRSRLVTKAPDR